MNNNLQSLISKLESWSLESSDFHADRQLADEVLIADGWQCEENGEFEGGFRWWYGVNPQYSTGDNRPHVINDLSTAIGVVPFQAKFRLEGSHKTGKFFARVCDMWCSLDAMDGTVFCGLSTRAAVAVLIAALKYKTALMPAVEYKDCRTVDL